MPPGDSPDPLPVQNVQQTGLPLISPDEGEMRLAGEIESAAPDLGSNKVPMIGIGGSAGAIPALKIFFETMPTDSGMVFVVVLHLAPDHESSLAEMIGRWTKMSVVKAKDGVPVVKDHVYVIPPGKHITSEDGHLKLSPLPANHARRVAVDLFFRSLADTHGAHCAAIILSGADGDGALGIKRLKERGGLAIAQDPEEAEHRGMPQAAIATGMVDWVLPVSEMPHRLQAFVDAERKLRLPPEDMPHRTDGPRTQDDAESALREVLAYLRTRTGRDFSYYKRPTIIRRIARRMQVTQVEDLKTYLNVLRTQPGEPTALLQDLLISVTNFFRDRDAFEALRSRLPQVFDGKTAGDVIRVWVPACATGEEAYSVAIMLLEHVRTLEAPPNFQVFACDLDESAIQVARAAVYPDAITADVSEERLRQFFYKDLTGYRITREVRERVLFASHDLIKDAPFSKMDLISCRNLLIYLKKEAQRRVFDLFHFALKSEGLLFLGASETVEEHSGLFSAVDKKHRIYAPRPIPRTSMPMQFGLGALDRAVMAQETANRTPVLPSPSFSAISPERQLIGLTPKAVPFPAGELHFHLIEIYAPPSLVINSEYEIIHLSEKATRFVQFSAREPSMNLLRVVHPALRLELRSALLQAMETASPVHLQNLPLELGGVPSRVNIRVCPAPAVAPGYLLVVFEPAEANSPTTSLSPAAPGAGIINEQLEREMERTKTRLRDTIEQYEANTEELKASNEEYQAVNEELRSTSEELETSREEMQSINEELSTVNAELKANVDELNQTNSDLRNLMASTAIPTIFLDREFRIMRYTPTAVNLFRILPADVGRPLADLQHTLNYPHMAEDVRRVLDLFMPVEREVAADGRWYLARLLPYKTVEDRIGGVVLAFVDITDAKMAAQAMEQSEEQFRRAITEAPIPVIMHAEDGQVLLISKTWTELTGYTQKEIPTFDAWMNLAYGTGAERVRDHIKGLFKGDRRQLDVELSIKTRSGDSRVWAFSASAPGMLRDGRRFIVGMALDVTERRKTDEALRQHEERLRLIVDNAREYAIFSLDLNRRITTWNAGAEKILQYSEAEIIGQSGDVIFTEEDQRAGAPEQEARTALNQGTAQDERWHCRKDRSRFWGSGVMMAMHDSGGAIIGFVKVFRDETNERKAKEAVEKSHRELQKALSLAEESRREATEANRAKDHFLATLSHELRTPLVPIRMTAESLLKKHDLPDRIRQGLTIICRNVDLETHFINDLLDLTRIGRGTFEMGCVEVDLHEAVHAAVEICSPELGARTQKITIELGASSSQVTGDFPRLQQVFWNILKNASKFTPEGGNIRISSKNESGLILVSIRDSGIGMNPGELTHIFEAFRQGDSDVARQYGGLGLGLAIAKATIDRLGGEIVAQSDGKNMGSTFTVRLPLTSSKG